MDMTSIVIKILADCGVPKNTTIEIAKELADNAPLYVGNVENIQRLLSEKLDFMSYLKVKMYFQQMDA